MEAPCSLSICVIGDDNLAAQLAKKGSETDIRMYNYKKGLKAITVSSSFRFPERIQSLIQAVNISDVCVLSLDNIDKGFGEAVMSLDALGMKKGFLILKNYITMAQIMPYIKDTVVENYEVFSGDINALRDMLFDMVPDNMEDSPPVVVIDQAFSVKGVGTVALGIVRSGSVKKHDGLKIIPSEKQTIVRSIQVHDEDTSQASTGSRVGLALKNVSPEDLPKGCVLSGIPIDCTESISLEIQVSKFFKGGINVGDIFHLISGLQMIPGRVFDGTVPQGGRGTILLKLEKPAILFSAGLPSLFHLDRFPRPAGKVLSASPV